MINRGVWRKIDKMKIPENRRLIGNKWVFKIKRDGTYRARLVALGYSKIPGVDFTDNFAPVAHDVSFRIALARMMVEKLGQPSIIKSLEQKFGEKAMKTRSSLTPGTPSFIARRLENEEDKVNAQDHETYRSGVGTLLYLTKHSRPDISNPVRELSKTMDAPAPAHLKEMNKLIRFVLETKDHGLKFKLMKSIRKWVMKALSDSDFASDKETRISIFGYVIYLNVLKNPYSRFGLIFSCADQFNSWCSPMLRCLFTCIFHNL